MKKIFLLIFFAMFLFSASAFANEGITRESHGLVLTSAKEALASKNYDKAITETSQLLVSNKNDPEIYYIRASALYEKKEYDKSISDIDSALRLAPSNDADYYLLRGRALTGKKFYMLAIKDINKYIQKDPYGAEGYYYRGLAYHDWGYFKEAIFDLDKAISTKPEFYAAYYAKGIALEGLGYRKEAARVYRDLLDKSDEKTEYGRLAKHRLTQIT